MDKDTINGPTTDLEGVMSLWREDLKVFAAKILNLKNNLSGTETKQGEDRGEELANLTLAYRHLEDCIMRLGKVIQAFKGGKSIYDKPVSENNVVKGN